jgi:hypothetical protein
MPHRAASRRSVAFGIVLALVAMALSFLAVLAATKVQAPAAAQQYAQAQASSEECDNTRAVDTFTQDDPRTTDPFQISGESFRLVFDTGSNSRLTVYVTDENAQRTGESFVVGSGEERQVIVPLGPGTFRLEIIADNGAPSYRIAVEDCLGANNINTNQQVTTAQQTTTAQTTAETTADDATAEAEAVFGDLNRADGVERTADAFRCEFFLHVVRDDRGRLHPQYADDELIVRRFEQCLSRDVLAQTIPTRRLPGTGGPHLLGLAALALISVVAGASVFRAGTRRRR